MSGLIRNLFTLSFIFTSWFYPTPFAHAAEFSPLEKSQQVEQLKEYVVSDTRLPTEKEDVYTTPAKVTVITSDDIQKMGARTVQEAVQHATGIFKFNANGNAFEDRVDLRGFVGENQNTSVFVDGVRVNQPDAFNRILFDLIPLEIVDRIEVHPGGSAIFGKFALGGTINIISKRHQKQRFVTGETAFGSFQRERYTINTGGPLGDFDYFANFSRETENGFRDNSSARVSRFFGKVGYHPTTKTDVDIAYTYVKDTIGQAGILPLSQAEIDPEANFSPTDFVDRESNFIRVNLKQVLPMGFAISGNGFYQKLEEETFNTGQSGFAFGSLVDIHSSGGVFQVTQDSMPLGFRNEMVFGTEFTWQSFETEFVGFTSQSETDEEVLGIFFQDAIHLMPDLILRGGLRYDRDEFDFMNIVNPSDSANKVFNRVTPRSSLTYLIRPKTSVYFSYSQNFRPPTIGDLTEAAGPGFNEDLSAVHSDNFEIGLKTAVSTWGNFELAFFQSDVKGEILLTCNLCDGVTVGDSVSRNLDKTRHRGIEVTMRAKPSQYADGEINYSYTEAQFRSPFDLLFPEVRSIEVGDSLPQVPKNRLSLLVNVYPIEGLILSLNGLYVSTQFYAADEDNSDPRLPGYFVLDGRVAYERPIPGGRLKAFLTLNNILGTEYFTFGRRATNSNTGGGAVERFVMTEPGITVFGGMSYSFDMFSE